MNIYIPELAESIINSLKNNKDDWQIEKINNHIPQGLRNKKLNIFLTEDLFPFRIIILSAENDFCEIGIIDNFKIWRIYNKISKKIEKEEYSKKKRGYT